MYWKVSLPVAERWGWMGFMVFQPKPFQDSNSSARGKACWELLHGENNLQRGLILGKLAGPALVGGEEVLGVVVCAKELGVSRVERGIWPQSCSPSWCWH